MELRFGSPELLVILGVCALDALIVGLVLAVSYLGRRGQVMGWRALAEGAGLSYEGGRFFFSAPRVTGRYRGRQVTLDTFTRRTGDSRTTYTRILMFVNNQANIYLAMYQESVFSKMGKFFGLQDVQIGDDEIDRRFVIKSKPETFAASLLSYINLRQRLLEARRLNVEVDGREITFEQVGVIRDVERLRFLIDLLSDLADAVERASR